MEREEGFEITMSIFFCSKMRVVIQHFLSHFSSKNPEEELEDTLNQVVSLSFRSSHKVD